MEIHFTTNYGLGVDAPKIAATPADLDGMPVLVVDDNDTNRHILYEMLRSWKIKPTMTDRGKSALLEIQRTADAGEPFQLILLDYLMPEMDGLEFARRVRNMDDADDPKIILLSSASIHDETERFRQLKISRRLTKPLKQSDLLNAILDVLEIQAVGSLQKPALSNRSADRPSLNILLAEDNLGNQQVAIGFLQDRGHRVVTANNGIEALDAFEKEPFDLILMDVQMPELDGLETTRAIREKEREAATHIPIIAMTTSAMKGDQERCLEAGMDNYVSKPEHADDLYRALNTSVASSCPPESDDSALNGSSASAGREAVVVTTAPNNDKVLGWKTAVERMQSREDLMTQLAQVFIDSCPQMMDDIRRAVETGDPEKSLRRAAHTLKGSAAVFDAERVVKAAWRLELMGNEGNLDETPEALADLETEIDLLMTALNPHCSKQTLSPKIPPAESIEKT